MRARLALIVVLAVAATACSPVELDGFLTDFGTTDLSASDDPALRSAGESAIEVLTIREAEEQLERGVAEQDLDAVRQAQALRPGDPKYDVYESALLAGRDDEGSTAASMEAMRRAGPKFATAYPDLGDRERGRVSQEVYIEALHDVVRAMAPSAERKRAREAYCHYILDYYPSYWTDLFPTEVSLFLATQADYSLC